MAANTKTVKVHMSTKQKALLGLSQIATFILVLVALQQFPRDSLFIFFVLFVMLCIMGVMTNFMFHEVLEPRRTIPVTFVWLVLVCWPLADLLTDLVTGEKTLLVFATGVFWLFWLMVAASLFCCGLVHLITEHCRETTPQDTQLQDLEAQRPRVISQRTVGTSTHAESQGVKSEESVPFLGQASSV